MVMVEIEKRKFKDTEEDYYVVLIDGEECGKSSGEVTQVFKTKQGADNFAEETKDMFDDNVEGAE